MFESKDGRVSGSIDRARVAELYKQTDDDDLKAYYRDLLGESEEGKSLDDPADGTEPEPTAAETTTAEAPIPDEGDLDDLRAQAEGLGVKVDGRWGEQRLREEIDAASAKGGDQ